jgi:hypothetical protein
MTDRKGDMDDRDFLPDLMDELGAVEMELASAYRTGALQRPDLVIGRAVTQDAAMAIRLALVAEDAIGTLRAVAHAHKALVLARAVIAEAPTPGEEPQAT